MEPFIPLGSICVGVPFQLQSSWIHVRIKSLLAFRRSQVNGSESRSDLFACRPAFFMRRCSEALRQAGLLQT